MIFLLQTSRENIQHHDDNLTPIHDDVEEYTQSRWVDMPTIWESMNKKEMR